MLANLKTEIAQMVAESANSDPKTVLPTIELSKMADISCKYAFILSKEKNKNPATIAGEIAGKIKKSENFDKTEANGPYINFSLSNKAYSSIVGNVIKQAKDYGRRKKQPGKIMIEFPSVNPNKPWHIGHLRNAILGDSVSRILESGGNQVEKMDYINDLGLQVAQSLWGTLNSDAKPHGKFDQWLGEQYVEVAKKFEENEKIAGEIRVMLKKMEEGSNDIAEKGRALAEDCVKAQYETSFSFGICHDVLVFESDIMNTVFGEGLEYIKKSDSVICEAEGKNKGCWVVKLDYDFGFGKMENPDKILIRSDGTAVYTGKDLIFHLWKFGKLKNRFKYKKFIDQPNGVTAYKTSTEGEEKDFGNASSAINVIGVEQKYPQKVIVEIFRKLNFAEEADNLRHLSYEPVGLQESKFSGRKGTWMGYTADNLLAEAKQRVLEKIKLDVSDDEKEKIALDVAVAAIKFAFLRTSSDKRITFKWETALNMEGDSGPYVQYAYVRTNGIFSRTNEQPEIYDIKFNDSEKSLIKKIAGLPDLVERCSRELAPHHLTQYVLDVAADFSSFYAASPVLPEPDERIRKSRLAITKATAITLKNSLNLLGIHCPERM
ncbi:arginine--tRNA ligase [Candidatus Micrarchaeota archaeon]|nr:arginine--tRNA ligase [Candidatus Micrarchaeota archaeon]